MPYITVGEENSRDIEIYYGMPTTEADTINADLLTFLKA
jgi:hypothetical protein